ncbi:MAG: PolC-type DNA polymerase III [Oscillospiraceae bacterium]|nr:PolC-type DNA polymerase III [Oscillospiraceae bacterium]
MTTKTFSEIFPSCLPAGDGHPNGAFDPVIKSLCPNREENSLTVELEGVPPSPQWAADAGRRIQETMGLSEAAVVFATPSPASGGKTTSPPAGGTPPQEENRVGGRPNSPPGRGGRGADGVVSPRRGTRGADGVVSPRRGTRGADGVVFGKPSRLKPTDIDVLPQEKAKACVRGRVFALGETRERRARIGNRWCEAVTVEFFVTDGTGSVCVRCVFEKGKIPPGLEKTLKDIYKGKGHVTVTGETASYTVMEKEEWFLAASCVEKADTPLRQDNAGQKRVELHLHTQMSDKDAVTNVSEAIETAARWGHPAVAVTDHGVCHAFPEAMAAGKKHGIKVLYGCEGYLSPPEGRKRAYHIILIARNQTGLKNLYRLISIAHIEHFKSRPRLPKDVIEQYREGLIIGAACERGEVFTAVKDNLPWEETLRIASFYDFLEIQPLCNNRFLIGDGVARDEEHLRDWNRAVVRLGKELDKPVCATGDVHFLDPEDEVYRDILLANMNMSGRDPLPLYFKTTDEMLEEFSYLGEKGALEVVVTGPQTVAGWAEDIRPVPKGEFFPKLAGSADELRGSVYERAHSLYGDDLPPLIQQQLEKELGSIIGKGYDTVYTVSQKLVRRSMENGYLVGSRGSIGSSIVAFFAGITEVNALPPHYRCGVCKYSEFMPPEGASCGVDLPDKNCPECGAAMDKDGFDIPFATFFGFDADKTPDIDLNFSSDYHERAGAHVTELFGADNVYRSGTISTIGGKNAVGYTLKYLEAAGKTVTDAELKRLAKGCEGVKLTTGQHPGGMIIVPEGKEIADFCPIHRAANKADGKICTHFDYHAIEENLLKLDILGHDCPTFLRRFEELTGEANVPLNDPDAMSLFSSTKALGFENDDLIGPIGTAGIPEYGTRFVRGMLQKTQPSTFDELIRISGLSHGTDVWRGNAETLIDSGKATLSEVICARDDITLYLVSKGLPDKMSFTLSENVRKGRGLKPEWEGELRAAGVPDWYINSCKMIKYLFPKAHAVAYAMMSARVAWFKAHKPEAFYAVYFTLKIDSFPYDICSKDTHAIKLAIKKTGQDKAASKTDQDKAVVMEVVYEMLRRGISFEPMDVHTAEPKQFIPAGPGRIAVPLMAVPGLGEAAADSIAEARKKGSFLAEDNILTRCRSVTKAHIEGLRNAGALGGMPETAQTTLFSIS